MQQAHKAPQAIVQPGAANTVQKVTTAPKAINPLPGQSLKLQLITN